MLGPGTARKTSMVTLQMSRGSAVGNPLVVGTQMLIMPSCMHSSPALASQIGKFMLSMNSNMLSWM